VLRRLPSAAIVLGRSDILHRYNINDLVLRPGHVKEGPNSLPIALPETHYEKSQVILRLSRRAKADPIIEHARGDFLKGTITVFTR
jgi:hypothetical protein